MPAQFIDLSLRRRPKRRRPNVHKDDHRNRGEEGWLRGRIGEESEFPEITLDPEVTIADPGQLELAESCTTASAYLFFIARSVNFANRHDPPTEAKAQTSKAQTSSI